MKPKITLCIVLLALLPLVACSSAPPLPIVTPAPSTASAATATPSTSTIRFPLPTAISGLPTDDQQAIEALVPQGEPAEEWNGVPIMPEAIAGDEDETGYVFSIAATAEEIQRFYETALGELGFTLLAVGHGQQEGDLLLIFMSGSATVALSLVPYHTLNLVLIVR
ncbi:MAG: hypothetical protein JXB85_03850 [Anaerolineales bacterium]|nr:hypothetical protein [Anaerolineales bacterium]